MRIKILIIIGIVSAHIYAQDTYKQITDLASVKAKIEATSKSLKSLKANFTQEKNLLIMDELIQSKGRFVYKTPNSVRWEYQAPYLYLIIINNGKISIKDEQKTNQMDMASNPIFKQINDLMLSTVKGDILLDPNFNSKVYESNKSYKLELLPQDKHMKEFISTIYLFLNKEDMSVNSIKIEEPMGDYTQISFKNKQLNATISEDSFKLN
jgi:outer membrane lipoprotein-sorting protein